MGAIRAVGVVGSELSRLGCDTRARANEPFKAPSNRMGSASATAPSRSADAQGDDVSFEPGRPMVDLSSARR
jgi:hypothetical protein